MPGNVEDDKGKKEDVNIIEMLREKTEETDMNATLKTAFGGYTKQSVLDYLSILKKNQQSMAETFRKNQQALYDEKEKLKKTNENLANRLNKVEAEYHSLSEAMQSAVSGNKEFSAKDILALKNTVSALEEEIKKGKGEQNSLSRRAAEKENTIFELMNQLDQLHQEADALKEMARAEKQESKKLRDLVAEVSTKLEAETDEKKYWKGLQTEGKQAELAAKVKELIEEMATQSQLLEKSNSDRDVREETIKTLTGEVGILKANIGSMNHMLDNLSVQNDKLLSANQALTSKMEEEYKKSVEIIREKSEVIIDKLIAEKKLNDEESRISMLELELNKFKRLDFGDIHQESKG